MRNPAAKGILKTLSSEPKISQHEHCHNRSDEPKYHTNAV
jgi:hypothetical protein